MRVRDAMTAEVTLISPRASLREAAEVMLTRGVEALLVQEGETLLGILGLRDLFTAPLSARHGGRMVETQSEEALRQTWGRQTVAHVMADQVLTISDEEPLLKAAALMVNTGKHPLPVRRDGRIVGWISREGILQVLLGAKER